LKIPVVTAWTLIGIIPSTASSTISRLNLGVIRTWQVWLRFQPPMNGVTISSNTVILSHTSQRAANDDQRFERYRRIWKIDFKVLWTRSVHTQRNGITPLGQTLRYYGLGDLRVRTMVLIGRSLTVTWICPISVKITRKSRSSFFVIVLPIPTIAEKRYGFPRKGNQ
jgi:hypothetical protein